MEKLRLRWPPLDQAIFQLDELFRLVFSRTAISDAVNTIFRQSEPADFDGAGMRVWHGREEVVRKLGGVGQLIRTKILDVAWLPWLTRPKLQYCFTNMDTGATMFDPFRFMLRQAYAEGTDLRLYTTPLNAAIYQLLDSLGLSERYDFWLRELVRINEEEAARAERTPYALWDFGNINTITNEAIPASGDLARMQWYWDHSHYRRSAGDLILDRVFSHDDPAHGLPVDFGMRVTGANIDAHLARSRAKLAAWVAANSELASQIVAAAGNPKAQNRQAEATCW